VGELREDRRRQVEERRPKEEGEEEGCRGHEV